LKCTAQRRFHHLVEKDGNGGFTPRAGRERELARLEEWVQGNVERLYRLAELK
jgi:hypothetical protein